MCVCVCISLVKDNDESHTLIIALSVVGLVLFGGLLFICVRRRNQIKSYIPIKYAVEVEKCSVQSGVAVMSSHVPNEMKARSRTTKTILSRLNSTTVPEQIEINENDCLDLRAAWHYLISTESKLCTDITREFLASHKKLVGTLANLTDARGRKAIHVAPPRNKNALKKLKRFVRSKRGDVKVHPIIHSTDGDDSK